MSNETRAGRKASGSKASNGLRALHADKRGAVLVEFAVAMMPLFITFFSFVELSQIAVARIVVKHATIVGARAASVISNKHRNTPDQKDDDNKGEIETAVRLAMGPWLKTMSSVTIDIDDKSSCDDPYGMVTVKVRANYRCDVPLGGRIVCGLKGNVHTIDQKFGFPHQGARYEEGGGAKCN